MRGRTDGLRWMGVEMSVRLKRQRSKQRTGEERCFTCEARSYSSTVTTAAAALPRLLRHFVLLSHTHSLSRTHLLTHALSVSVRFNPPSPSLSLSRSLSTAFSLIIPPAFHHLLSVIHPSLSSGFPPSLSQHLAVCQKN